MIIKIQKHFGVIGLLLSAIVTVFLLLLALLAGEISIVVLVSLVVVQVVGTLLIILWLSNAITNRNETLSQLKLRNKQLATRTSEQAKRIAALQAKNRSLGNRLADLESHIAFVDKRFEALPSKSEFVTHRALNEFNDSLTFIFDAALANRNTETTPNS